MMKSVCPGCGHEQACGHADVTHCADRVPAAWCSCDMLRKAEAEQDEWRRAAESSRGCTSGPGCRRYATGARCSARRTSGTRYRAKALQLVCSRIEYFGSCACERCAVRLSEAMRRTVTAPPWSRRWTGHERLRLQGARGQPVRAVPGRGLHRAPLRPTQHVQRLKLDCGMCNSIRISDHRGKKHLAYRYNIGPWIKKRWHDHDGRYPRHYYPIDEADVLVANVLRDRERRKSATERPSTRP
ncbi:MAG: hypothetical protein ACLSVD_02925 [Eggerthellaceae bacterium]